MTKGVLAVAQGSYFVYLAINLAKSIRRVDKKVALAVVTDDVMNKELESVYDHVIQITNPNHQKYVTKLYLNEYTPFDETLFIDADSLVVSPIDHLWVSFENQNFSVLGGEMTYRAFNPNHFFSMAKLKKQYNLVTYLGFNGGVYYFKKNQISARVFKTAQELIDQYDYYEMPYYRNSKGDEPLIALAMAINDCKSVPNPATGMFLVSAGYHSIFNLNILKNRCSLLSKDKLVTPSIAHFGTAYTFSLIYRREVYKLCLNTKFPKVSQFLINIISNLIYNPIIFCCGQFQRLRFYKLGVFKFMLRRSKLALRYKVFGFSNFLYLSVKQK